MSYPRDYTLEVLMGVTVSFLFLSILLGFVACSNDRDFQDKCRAQGGIPRVSKYDGWRCLEKSAVEATEIDIRGELQRDLKRAM